MAFADGMQHVYRLTRCTPRFTPYSLRTLADNAHFCCRKAQQELGFGARPLIDTMRDLVAWHLNPIAFAEL